MNSFETRAIQTPRHEEPRRNRKGAKTWIKSHIFLSLLALVLGLFTLKGVVGAIANGNPFSVKQIFISAVGQEVETDAYGHTNVLLVGVGGEGHDGENLTDTMMVASIDHDTNTVSMISIPRDFYVENEEVGWGTRINSIYEYVLDETEDPLYAMDQLRGEIEEVFDVELHYYAKIDFQGFVDIVDALGGITVNVEQTIIDDAYPAPDGSDYLYDPFYLEAGVQKLDGETALKYVRSRHNTSDFDRARRQQEVISAIKDKAMSMGMLTSPSQIKDLYWAISSNFETDMELDEMLSLVDFAEGLTGDSIFSAVISDDATSIGGFLYTPPREENEPYYLIPYAGEMNFVELQLFAQLFLYHPEITMGNVPIEVLNGTKEDSLAGLTKMYLKRYGFNVVSYGNALDRETSDTQIISLVEGNDATLELLPTMTFGEITSTVPAEYQPVSRPTEAKIIIILGEDFAEFYEEHDELFYIGIY
ncbi:MAG: LCP family protein [Patescibacteria group bacterium]